MTRADNKFPRLFQICFFVLLMILFSGCDLVDLHDPLEAQDDYDPFADQALPTNNKFLGYYDLSLTVGNCPVDDVVYIIGTYYPDRNMQYYLYIFEHKNESNYTGAQEPDLNPFESSILIDGRIITVDTVGQYPGNPDLGWSKQLVLEFSEDYSTFIISGTIQDDIEAHCQGIVSGFATRQSDEEADTNYGEGDVGDYDVDEGESGVNSEVR